MTITTCDNVTRYLEVLYVPTNYNYTDRKFQLDNRFESSYIYINKHSFIHKKRNKILIS